MSAPVAIANAVADAVGVDAVELPLTPARVWELLRVKPAPFEYVRGRVGRARGRDPARARRRGEGAGGRAEPRPRAEHAARAAARAHRPQPRRRARRGRRQERHRARRRARAPGARSTADRARACPLLAEALPHVGHARRATAAPSAARSRTPTPAAELPLCLALARRPASPSSRRGRREIAADDFFVTHFTTTLEPDELVVETTGRARRRRGFAFEEFALRHGDFALCDGRVRGVERSDGRSPRDRRGRRPARCSSDTERPGERGRRGGRAARPNLHASADRTWRRLSRRVLVERAVERARSERRDRVDVTVNGRPHREEVEPRLLLSDFLRHTLGLTGTHVGCEHGVCGACTVRLDGAAVARASCSRSRRTAPSPDRRGPGGRRRAAAAAGGVPRASRAPVRLLHAGDPDGGGRPARAGGPADAGGDRRSALRPSVPLHRLRADRRRDRRRWRRRDEPRAQPPLRRRAAPGRARRSSTATCG